MRVPAACLAMLSMSALAAEEVLPPTLPATATAPAPPPPVNARLSLGVGYDSNILLLPEGDPIITNHDSAVYSGDARISWRAIDHAGAHLDLIATTHADQYAERSDRRLWEYGAAVAGSLRRDRISLGMTIAGDRFDIAGSGAATVVDAAVDCTVVGIESVVIPQLEVIRLDYDEVGAASGWLYDASYRHWFLINPGSTRRRIELGLRTGYFLADTDSESYFTARPSAGFRYRFGETVDRDTFDLVARYQVDFRAYRAAATGADRKELAYISGFELASDYWLSPWVALGVYSRYSQRSSNVAMRDYDRIQIGARITAGW